MMCGLRACTVSRRSHRAALTVAGRLGRPPRKSARQLCFSLLVRQKSSVAVVDNDDDEGTQRSDGFGSDDIRRLTHLRNVGILAHVDAGKTTVTERMLALAGVVRRPGTVDSGSTVTDYLPAERERGITIQSAAIGFSWGWHNSRTGDDYDTSDEVQIRLIDTPGHVDFSVEVNRSVAVLDGAVLVVDAVAGAQAQTETVWRAITRPSLNNHLTSFVGEHGHEPLPCLAFVNKMDKEGCNCENAIDSIRQKLDGANPVATQMPLFRTRSGSVGCGSPPMGENIFPVPVHNVGSSSSEEGEFVGVVDLVHMRSIVWPNNPEANGPIRIEDSVPKVRNLMLPNTHEPVDATCPVTAASLESRSNLIASLADVDESIEEYYLLDEEPSNAELRAALRRATLARKALPVLVGAALKGKGVEPLLDAVADLLPSPLDRMPPAVTELDGRGQAYTRSSHEKELKRRDERDEFDQKEQESTGHAQEQRQQPIPLSQKITLGHPLHPTLLALAFKVVHMKGRGGSGDGRVVFARVYSGKIKNRDQLTVISPKAPGELAEKPRTERVGGMLELAGGRFDNLQDGLCLSGDVCALVGLKSVVTGDTILAASHRSSDSGLKSISAGGRKSNRRGGDGAPSLGNICLAGVSSPRPVLTVRVEAESTEQQSRLSDALNLLSIEDPSLAVEDTESATLLSGLGELHIEVTLDRLRREHGLAVTMGSPSVAYRETITHRIETGGGTLYDYDRTVGGTRLQASVHIVLEPFLSCIADDDEASLSSTSCMILSEPVMTVGPRARAFLGMDMESPVEELVQRCDVFQALIGGCLGSMKRGALGSYAMANVRCHVVDVDAEGGLPSLVALPGSLRAAASQAISATLAENLRVCSVLEPKMSVEVTVPADLVGSVLSDLTSRRGTVGDVFMGDGNNSEAFGKAAKALVRGEVPLVEILGYAKSLRSLTGGEGAFTAEYKGHSLCDQTAR